MSSFKEKKNDDIPGSARRLVRGHELFTPTHTGLGERAKREGWGHYEIDASHNPHITAPEALADLLDGIAAGRPLG